MTVISLLGWNPILPLGSSLLKKNVAKHILCGIFQVVLDLILESVHRKLTNDVFLWLEMACDDYMFLSMFTSCTYVGLCGIPIGGGLVKDVSVMATSLYT